MSTTAENGDSLPNRAVRLQGKGQTSFASLPIQHPGAGEILLRLRSCGLCGTDLFKIDQDRELDGQVLGHEVVGTVIEMGAGVDSFAIGDRIVTPHHVPCGRCHFCLHDSQTLCDVFRADLLVPGGFSELFIVRSRAVEQAARKVPDSIRDEVALFLEPAACVLRGIERAGLPASHHPTGQGSTALILGAGSMGLLHLLVLRSLYPDLAVVISDPLPSRREMAARLGANSAIDPEALDRGVAAMTEGRGADCVFDTVGRPGALRPAIDATREGATVVLFAHARPGDELQIELNSIFKSERRLVGTYSGGPDEQAKIWQLLIDGALDPSPLVTHRLPLSRFQEGIRLVLARQALKVVFEPDEEIDSELA